MTYFSKFPLALYSFDGKNAILITDFLRRVNIAPEVLNNDALYSPYSIQDGETPDMIAHRFYGSSTLHWIILLTNQIVDPRFDWCLSQKDLVALVQGTYTNIYGVHHYENASGMVVDQTLDAYPVSNLENETRINESKRIIKILNPALVSQFVREFEDKIKR